MNELVEMRSFDALVRDNAFKLAMLFGMVLWSVAGSYAFKKAAVVPNLNEVFFGFAMAAWTFCALCFVMLLKTGPLGTWGPISTVVQLALVMAVSSLALSESYTTSQWIATSVAVVAVGVSLSLAE